MQKRLRAGYRGFVLVAFFIMSASSLFLGLSLCLVKSPAVKAGYYISASQHYIQQVETETLQSKSVKYLLEQSRVALTQALETDPYNVDGWASLSLTLARLDDMNHAMQAREIAGLLGVETLPTLNAVHNMLPARPLILSDNQNHQTITQ